MAEFNFDGPRIDGDTIYYYIPAEKLEKLEEMEGLGTDHDKTSSPGDYSGYKCPLGLGHCTGPWCPWWEGTVSRCMKR